MLDIQGIEAAILILVAFGGFLSPVAFAFTELIKPFVSGKYLKIISVLAGGLIGVALAFVLPHLGIAGVNYVVGLVGGLVGGYIATKQYETAADHTYDKIGG